MNKNQKQTIVTFSLIILVSYLSLLILNEIRFLPSEVDGLCREIMSPFLDRKAPYDCIFPLHNFTITINSLLIGMLVLIKLRYYNDEKPHLTYYLMLIGHHLNRLPKIKNLHLILLVVLIVIYLLNSVVDLSNSEYNSWEISFVQPYVESCTVFDLPEQRALLKFYQFCLSQNLFDNRKIIPFIESIGIVILGFLITNRLVESKFAGLLTVSVMLLTNTFTQNAVTTNTSVEWVFFFLLSIYFVYHKPVLAGIPYLLSLFGKGVGLLLLPVVVYLIWNMHLPPKDRNKALLSILMVIPFTILWIFFVGNNIVQTNVPIGFNETENILALLYVPIWNFTGEVDDSLLLYVILPLTLIGLLRVKYRNGLNKAILVFLIYTFSMQVWLPMISGYGMGNYRMVPMSILLAVGFTIISYDYIKHNFLNYEKRLSAK